MDTGFLLGLDGNVTQLIVGMATQLCECAKKKISELPTLK